MKSEAELIAEGSKYIPKDYDPDLYRIRHSAAHVMAQAVGEVYPGTKFAIGPPTDTGFYYDFRLDHPLSEEDFPQIEAEMETIIKADERFERLEMPRGEALQLCSELGQGHELTEVVGLRNDQPALCIDHTGQASPRLGGS